MLVTLLRGGLNGDNENRAKTGKSFIIILESCTFWQYSACAHGNITDTVELCKILFQTCACLPRNVKDSIELYKIFFWISCSSSQLVLFVYHLSVNYVRYKNTCM